MKIMPMRRKSDRRQRINGPKEDVKVKVDTRENQNRCQEVKQDIVDSAVVELLAASNNNLSRVSL